MAHMANHILSKEGILTTFSISKRILIKDVLRLQKNIKIKKSLNPKIQNLLYEKMIEETKKAFLDKKIPGLTIPDQGISNEEKKIMMELTYFASVVAKKMDEKRIDKFHSCYIINAIVNILGLDEKAFEDFHKKFSKYRNNSENDNEDESPFNIS